MGARFGAGPDLPYAERVEQLKASGVAVWDVLQSCVREGSLDADIRSEVPNDFADFFSAHPTIRCIGLNGGKAAASFRKHAAHCLPVGVQLHVLPSTSPAHAARGLEEKCALWRLALLS
jgi:TDG/mug DNA glycosylase family protein